MGDLRTRPLTVSSARSHRFTRCSSRSLALTISRPIAKKRALAY
jgi:hypothetical protein